MKVRRPFIQSQYVSSVFTSARGSACDVKVAFRWQYALQPSQPLPVSHASKNFIATSVIGIVLSFSRGQIGWYSPHSSRASRQWSTEFCHYWVCDHIASPAVAAAPGRPVSESGSLRGGSHERGDRAPPEDANVGYPLGRRSPGGASAGRVRRDPSAPLAPRLRL